jgi:hypothetical protein
MIDIAPGRLLPLATLLSLAFAAGIGAAIILAAWHLRDRAGRLAIAAAMGALVLTAASAVFRSSREAGTGHHTAFGWPRAVYTRWVSWETSERIQGVRLRGVTENAMFYAPMIALAGSLGLAARRSSVPGRRERGAADP